MSKNQDKPHNEEDLSVGFVESLLLKIWYPITVATTSYQYRKLVNKHFDQTVIQIIFEHEELINGTGFPQGLSESKISRDALIVGVANAFDRAMSIEGRSAADAMKHLIVAKMGLYPLGHLNALKEVLKEQGIA